MINCKDVIEVRKLGQDFLCVDTNPFYKYENGEKTNIVAGQEYDILSVAFQFEKIKVKVHGEDAPNVALGDINDMVKVDIEGLEINPYVLNNKIMLSFKAIKVVTKGK